MNAEVGGSTKRSTATWATVTTTNSTGSKSSTRTQRRPRERFGVVAAMAAVPCSGWKRGDGNGLVVTLQPRPTWKRPAAPALCADGHHHLLPREPGRRSLRPFPPAQCRHPRRLRTPDRQLARAVVPRRLSAGRTSPAWRIGGRGEPVHQSCEGRWPAVDPVARRRSAALAV